jgi:hypothetical protein
VFWTRLIAGQNAAIYEDPVKSYCTICIGSIVDSATKGIVLIRITMSRQLKHIICPYAWNSKDKLFLARRFTFVRCNWYATYMNVSFKFRWVVEHQHSVFRNGRGRNIEHALHFQQVLLANGCRIKLLTCSFASFSVTLPPCHHRHHLHHSRPADKEVGHAKGKFQTVKAKRWIICDRHSHLRLMVSPLKMQIEKSIITAYSYESLPYQNEREDFRLWWQWNTKNK